LPVLSLSTLLGGIDPLALGLAFLITTCLALLGCTLALTLSVWAKKTHDVLMATYAIWVVLLLFQPIWQLVALSGPGVAGPPSWVLHLNPFWLAFAAYSAPNQVKGADYAVFFAATLGASLLLMIVAVARMRAVSLRDNEPATRRRPRAGLGWIGRLRRALPGPTLDSNPVLWREWHRNRPSRWSRLIWLTLALATTIGGSWSVVDMLKNGVGPPSGPDLGVFVVILQITLGLLLLSVSAATSLSEERTRGSLDVLLATPLSTWSIVWGKWWGAFRIVPLLAFWPGLIAAVMAFSLRKPLPPGWPANYYYVPGIAARLFSIGLIIATVLCHGAAITSLGLALATRVPKQGRAVALCVAAYVIVCLGWIFLVMAIFSQGSGRLAEGLAMLSPIFAAGALCEGLVLGQPHSYEIRMWATFWALIVGTAAVVLFVLMYVSFDDCLGRISDWRDLPGPWDDDPPDPQTESSVKAPSFITAEPDEDLR
ncbi:MAG: ABC transporter permease subunit, partial [Isosphaeraceae bacterium]